MRDDDFQIGKGTCNLVEQVRAGVFHLGLGGKMRAGVKDYRQMECGGAFEDGHSAGIGGVTILGGGADAQAAKAPIVGDVADLIDGIVIGGIDARKAEHAIGMFAAR